MGPSTGSLLHSGKPVDKKLAGSGSFLVLVLRRVSNRSQRTCGAEMNDTNYTNPALGLTGGHRQSAVNVLRERAERLRKEADRLDALASECQFMPAGSPAERALWDLATYAR